MPWPSVTIDTTAMDAGTDDASVARAQIKQMADNVNAIMNMRGVANGVASLDAGALVPTAQLPTIPANKGGTGQNTYTVGDVLYASGAAALSKLAAGTAGYQLTSNGPGSAPSYQQSSNFPSGTRMIFQQTAAPPGWTKETNSAYNNAALRLVTGTVGSGGTNGFTGVFNASKSTDAFTLTTAHIPAHGHYQHRYTSGVGAGTAGGPPGNSADASPAHMYNNLGTDSTGSGGSHSHTIPTMDLKYQDFITAQKD